MLLQNCQRNGYRCIFRHFTVHWMKSAIEGTTKPRGGYRYWPFTVMVHLSGKNTMYQFKTAKQRYTGGFSASWRYNERKSAIEGTTGTKGGYRYLPFAVKVQFTPFWQKYDVLSQNCQTKVYRGFCGSLRYIERTKPRGEYRYSTVYYCYGIPLSGKKYDVPLCLTWFFTT